MVHKYLNWKQQLFVLIYSSLLPYVCGMEVVSPNNKIRVALELQNESHLYFKVYYSENEKEVEVLPLSSLGLKTSTEDFSSLVLASETPVTLIHDDYEMLHGKKKHCENLGTEKTFRFKNPSGKCIDIVFRAYNDGVAFRYLLSDYSESVDSIADELTVYAIPNGVKRWVQPYKISYEDFYPLSTSGIRQKRWSYPALFNVEKDVFLLITESDISAVNYASSLYTRDNESYQVALPPDNDNGNRFMLPWQSPWRVLMIGHLNDIVESTLVTDVSRPCQLSETGWIKPGAASWIYWANNHGSKDYQKLVEYVDLAVDMQWPYTLIDAEWDQMGNGGAIKDIVTYANGKGIKPLLWYNSGTYWMDPTPNDRMNASDKRAKEFAWLNQMGVYGVKVDFFPGDQQKTMQHYISILEDAARNKLMVNFHGATVPRGWDRTYPNLMTVEGVYGAEWYNNRPVLTNKAAVHNATLPFTRNVIGPMDYTPVTFTDSQHKHITSYAHELALSVIFESGIQHFADRPAGYYDLPNEPKEFLKTVPVDWDDTKLVDGYPGENVIIARRKGSQWYIGGINGSDAPKTLTLSFDFIEKDNCQLKLIKDGSDDKSFKTEKMTIKKGQKLPVPCLPRGGFVGILE